MIRAAGRIRYQGSFFHVPDRWYLEADLDEVDTALPSPGRTGRSRGPLPEVTQISRERLARIADDAADELTWGRDWVKVQAYRALLAARAGASAPGPAAMPAAVLGRSRGLAGPASESDRSGRRIPAASPSGQTGSFAHPRPGRDCDARHSVAGYPFPVPPDDATAAGLLTGDDRMAPSTKATYRETKSMMNGAPPMPAGSALRSFRTDVLRDLARRALEQGWDAYRTGGGHVRLVNPTSGAMVELSTTANGRAHGQENVRQALMRAGVDLRSKAERRRDERARARLTSPRTTQETTPMMADPIPTDTAPEPVTTTEPTTTDDPPVRPFARIDEKKLTIGDREVLTWTTASGQAWAMVAAAGGTPYSAGRKGFSAQEAQGGMAEVMRRVHGYIERGEVPHAGRGGSRYDASGERRPRGGITVRQATPDELERAFGPTNGANGYSTTTADQATPRTAAQSAVPSAGPDPSSAGPAVPPAGQDDEVWVSARPDPAAYPIAHNLDLLDQRVGPAIEALEAAGKTDAAALIRAELATTPAEAELLRLYRELMDRPGRAGRS